MPAWLLGQRFEVVGGPVFAILIGMVIALFWKDQKSAKSGITYTSKKVLQLAVVLLGAGAFGVLYAGRIKTMSSIQKITDYSDGYNLYRMNVDYDYQLDDIIKRGITDDQSMIDAILAEALPLLPDRKSVV